MKKLRVAFRSFANAPKNTMYVGNGVQVLTSSAKLARVRLIQVTVPLFPYHINYHDPFGTPQDTLSLNQLKFSTKIH